jgi:hypothetical protein
MYSFIVSQCLVSWESDSSMCSLHPFGVVQNGSMQQVGRVDPCSPEKKYFMRIAG